jgi:hypothetical protein
MRSISRRAQELGLLSWRFVSVHPYAVTHYEGGTEQAALFPIHHLIKH